MNENRIERAKILGDDALVLELTKGTLISLITFRGGPELHIHGLTLEDCNLLKSVLEKRIAELENEEIKLQAIAV